MSDLVEVHACACACYDGRENPFECAGRFGRMLRDVREVGRCEVGEQARRMEALVLAMAAYVDGRVAGKATDWTFESAWLSTAHDVLAHRPDPAGSEGVEP